LVIDSILSKKSIMIEKSVFIFSPIPEKAESREQGGRRQEAGGRRGRRQEAGGRRQEAGKEKTNVQSKSRAENRFPGRRPTPIHALPLRFLRSARGLKNEFDKRYIYSI
jgi:hypothetical protein